MNNDISNLNVKILILRVHSGYESNESNEAMNLILNSVCSTDGFKLALCEAVVD